MRKICDLSFSRAAWRLIHRAGPDHAPASQAFGFRIRVVDLLYVSPTGSE